jgi:hypothetical protein
MSDRKVAVGKDDRTQRWIRTVEDRITQLETRRLQGAISMESVLVGALGASATPATPIVLHGDTDDWTVDLEKLSPGGRLALVFREVSTGTIMDVLPRPFIGWAGGAAVSVPAGSTTQITTWGVSVCYPFGQSEVMLDNGISRVPLTGMWDVKAYGAFAGVADATERLLITQFSTNGGNNYSGLYNVSGTGFGTATEGYHLSLSTESGLTVGWLFRVAAFHRSLTTPINFVPSRYSLRWQGPIL